MKRRHKPRAKGSRALVKGLRNRKRVVKKLAAQGFSGDVIAAKLGLEKNHLRAEHALDRMLAAKLSGPREQQLKPPSYPVKNASASRSSPTPGIPSGARPCFMTAKPSRKR